MRQLFGLPATAVVLIALASLADGQNPTRVASTTLTANPATITVGASVTVKATVQPDSVQLTPGAPFSKPSGTITFLDGTVPLGSAAVALVPNVFGSAPFQQIFGTPDPMLTQRNVQGALTGDLNGDGVADLLLYSFPAAQAFISNGKAGYAPAALQTLSFTGNGQYPTGGSVPVLIDLNGDGKLDLVDGIQAAYGNGDGTFAAPIPISFLSSGYVTTYAADLNGDGKTDILAVNSIPGPLDLGGPYQISVTVFLNQGGGAFATAGTFPAPMLRLGVRE